MSAAVSSLPCASQPVSYPFSGFVLNLNVSTICHKDGKDHILCLIIVLSKCRGGGLGLVEPGLFFNLQNGDMFIFDSCKLSHLNDDFEGKRASLVFTTDKEMLKWSDRNGWENHIMFSSSKK